MDTFGTRLRSAMDKYGPLCVGIDPHPHLLVKWGVGDSAEGLARFTAIVAEALAGRIAVVKPQSAFFERFGAAGVAILESTIRQFREAGTVVLLDVKRGDIGSTAAAYADAYLDPARPLAVDAITVHPFLGFGSLLPVIETAARHGNGVFVLALTSNPEGAEVQHAACSDGRTVAQRILDAIAQVNAGIEPMGMVGAVIGATVGRTGHNVTHINGPILVPGMGAQGGNAADLRTVFGKDLSNLLPSYSREVLDSGPGVGAIRDAAERVMVACRGVIEGRG